MIKYRLELAMGPLKTTKNCAKSRLCQPMSKGNNRKSKHFHAIHSIGKQKAEIEVKKTL